MRDADIYRLNWLEQNYDQVMPIKDTCGRIKGWCSREGLTIYRHATMRDAIDHAMGLPIEPLQGSIYNRPPPNTADIREEFSYLSKGLTT